MKCLAVFLIFSTASPFPSVLDVCLVVVMVAQVLSHSLEAHVMQSDNSSLAKDCRKDIKAANTRLMKLGRKVCNRILPSLHCHGIP